jgi:UDP-glucose 4-epimerase
VRGARLQSAASQQVWYTQDAIDLCYVKDCARAIALLQTVDAVSQGTYNVGAGRATSNAELIAAVHDVVPTAQLVLRAGRDPAGPGRDTWLDIGRLSDDTGYQPEHSTSRAVADYIGWLRAGNDR